MRNILTMCFAALASASAVAATVKTATQPWVEAKISDATNATLSAAQSAASAAQSAASAAISAATNGLVTASVTNGLASAASVSAAVASATNGLASQSSLTSLSSRVDDKRDKTDLAVYGADGKPTADTLAKTSDLTTAGVLNSNGQSGIPLSTHLSFVGNAMETIYKAGGVNFWNGREVYDLLFPTNKENGKDYTIATTEDIPAAVADLSDAGDYLKTADLAAKETDPSFNAWTNGTNLAAGYQAVVKAGRKQCTVFGSYAAAYADKGSAFGYFARVGAQRGTAIGYNAYVPWDWTGAIGFAQFPTNVYFGADIDNQTEDGAWVETPRTLQSYLDERATTNALAAVKASIPAISATDATFSNAVLAVGLNIDTNAVAQINELLTNGAKLPTSGVATVGGLLAALAAGLAALKKSVSSLSSKVDDANAALEEVA